MATVIQHTADGRVVETDTTPLAVAHEFYRVVYLVMDVVEVLLGFRFLFRLIGASAGSQFVSLVYAFSNSLVAPFVGILRQPTINGATIEWSSVIAMLVYALVAYGLVRLVGLIETDQ